jgi:hypothetical protein
MEARRGFTIEDVHCRATKGIESAVAFGTTRTHCDVGDGTGVGELGLSSVEALHQIKREYAWALDLQVARHRCSGRQVTPRPQWGCFARQWQWAATLSAPCHTVMCSLSATSRSSSAATRLLNGCETTTGALAAPPAERTVVKRGRVVARTRQTVELFPPRARHSVMITVH